MTRAGREKLRSVLEELRRRHREELAHRLRDARSYGDGSNNDEYHALREEQMVLEARIALLEATVRRAVVTDTDQLDGVAGIGSTVSIEDLASHSHSRHRLASAHAGGNGGISAASPLGQALIGARPGAVVTFELPNGRSRSVRLTAVEPGDPAHDGL
jgi:transcription elongation factor GreA